MNKTYYDLGNGFESLIRQIVKDELPEALKKALNAGKSDKWLMLKDVCEAWSCSKSTALKWLKIGEQKGMIQPKKFGATKRYSEKQINEMTISELKAS